MPELYQEFITFEKKHGSKDGIEEVIVGKRRLQVCLRGPRVRAVRGLCEA